MEKLKTLYKYHYLIAFLSTLTVALGLIISSLFIPPKGKIDPSVLTACGIVFLWPSLALGAKALDEGKKIKMQNGSTSVSIGGDENRDNRNIYGEPNYSDGA